jgi:CBS domain-containing protein
MYEASKRQSLRWQRVRRREHIVSIIEKKRSYSVVDVMQTDVYSLTPDTSVGSALSVLMGEAIDHVLVVDHGMLAGILSKDDLCWTDRAAPVGECVMPPVQCVGPETSITEAAGLMVEKRLSCLAVTVDALLVGIVSKAELDEVQMVAGDEDEGALGLECASCAEAPGIVNRFVLPGVPLCERCAGKVGAMDLKRRPQA